MAPPKRKITGRVTPKGTRPGQATTPSTTTTQAGAVNASTRYTPPTRADLDESPRWLPILMAVLIGLGVLCIILRYLVWDDTNTPVLAGLVFLLGGLYLATKWK